MDHRVGEVDRMSQKAFTFLPVQEEKRSTDRGLLKKQSNFTNLKLFKIISTNFCYRFKYVDIMKRKIVDSLKYTAGKSLVLPV